MILYRCISKNSLGETDGHIMLYKLEVETEEDEAACADKDFHIIEPFCVKIALDAPNSFQVIA